MTSKLYTPDDNKRLCDLVLQLNDERFKGLVKDDPADPSVPLFTTPFKCTPFGLFAPGKKDRWSIDNSPIQPTPATCRQGKAFAKVYLDQLNTILYHGGDEPPMSELTEVMYLYERIVHQGTVHVTSGVSVRRLPTIVLTLNQFFIKNIHVIDAIATMVGNRIAPAVNPTNP